VEQVAEVATLLEEERESTPLGGTLSTTAQATQPTRTQPHQLARLSVRLQSSAGELSCAPSASSVTSSSAASDAIASFQARIIPLALT
jgi:hypothetical protein